jgi:hypothetical protein
MNRNVVIAGVVAVAILLAVAAYFLISGRTTSTTGQTVTGEPAGPIALNNVSVITDHSTSQSEDGRTLSVTFPKFELAAKGGETTSAVFSTTWRLKLAPEERAVVAAVSIKGYMKSAGTPAPAPAPVTTTTEPAVAAAPAEGTAAATTTPPAEGATPPAEQPAVTPAPAAPAKPVAGDGVARVIVSIGGDISITEWRDWNGEGAEHKVSKAVAFASAGTDLRDGATVPVTVTVEVFGAMANDTLARLNSLDLRVFPESAPLPSAAPATTEAPAEVTPPAETTTPPAEGTTPPAEGTTPPAAEGTTTTPAPAEGTTPPQ